MLFGADRVTATSAGGAGTPLAGVLLDPFPHTAGGRLVAAALQLVALVALARVLVSLLGNWPGHRRPGRRARAFGAPVLAVVLLAGALLVLAPVRAAIGSHTPTLWVLAGVLVEARSLRDRPLASRVRPPRGMLIGLAAAAQPGMALFAVLFARVAHRRRAFAAAAGSFAFATLFGWLLRPGASATYWLHGGLLSGLLSDGGASSTANQSLRGLAAQLGWHGAALTTGWLVSAAVVLACTLPRADRYWRDRQLLLAVGLVGCAAALAEPVSRSDALLWLGLAACGRLGHRPQDRSVWPAVALVPLLLPGHVLDPHIDPVSSFLLRSCAAVLAIACCTALPFRRTDDSLWRLPRVAGTTGVAATVGAARRRPLLPSWLRGVGRPNLVFELLLVQVGYGFYTWIRNAAPDRSRQAIASGQRLYSLERFLHIDVERSLNRFALHMDWLEDALEHYYKTFHFAVPLAVLVWLYWRHPAHYRPARTALCLCTGLALVGFWAYPLAPPRLTPGHGFRDTLHPGADADPFGAFTKVANQFAAMPSLHIGWSTWCAVVIICLAPYWWVRALGAIYPLCTLFAILATANHWVLDAVGGALTLAIAWQLQYLLTGRRLADPETISIPSPPPDSTTADADKSLEPAFDASA